MHLHFNHRHLLLNSIINYFDNLSQRQTITSVKTRSAEAKKRRNHRAHEKFDFKRKQFFIKRQVSILWKPRHIKFILVKYNLKYANISEVHKHTVRLLFNNPTDRDFADWILPDDIFDEKHFHDFFHDEH